MKRSVSGDRLWRDLQCRVVIPGQKDAVIRRVCPPRRGWSAADLDEIFEDIAERLEKQFPTIEFRVVELAENQVNFIYAGRKEQMEAPNYCPAEARSSTIAKEVCAKQGHDIRVFQGNTRATPQGPVMEAMNFCTRCGFSVNEVRGQVEEMFRAAVGNEVSKRIGAQAAALAAQGPTPPSGEPGEKIIELPSGTAAEVARTAKAAATEA